jgi:hypothetical protein
MASGSPLRQAISGPLSSCQPGAPAREAITSATTPAAVPSHAVQVLGVLRVHP